MTNPQTLSDAHAEAEALVLERNPKSVEWRAKKTAVVEKLERKLVTTAEQIRICQESLLRTKQELEEKQAQIDGIDRLIREAVTCRVRAEEIRPEVQAGISAGREDLAFTLLQQELLTLDRMVNSLDSGTAKQFFNHGGQA